MKIHKNTWHYDLYEASYSSLLAKEAPSHTTLCQYMRRLIFMIPLAFFLILTLAPFWLCLFALKTFVYFFFGKGIPRRFILFEDYILVDDQKVFVPYPPARIGKLSFYPWQFVLVVGGLTLLGYLYCRHTQTALITTAGLLALVLITLNIEWLVAKLRKSETLKIFIAYLKAKKTHICPLVEFYETVEG